MLKKELLKTKDGSYTLFIPEWNEHYHSKHGAIQEAEHVFIQHGLSHFIQKEKIAILEIGFGTGLNALLTAIFGFKQNLLVDYIAVEKYPVANELVESLNYETLINSIKEESVFKKMHRAEWGARQAIDNNFNLTKLNIDFYDIQLEEESIDLIYFDAFGIRVQPELWTEDLFSILFKVLKKDGLLTTYACNGRAKRALQAVGFGVEKLPGPPGKREMMNAWKR